MTESGDCKSPLLKFTVSSPGKLILCGEHSVVYDKSALAASINKRTYIKFYENTKNEMFVLDMKDINLYYNIVFEDIIKIIIADIPGYDLKPLTKPIDDPNDINHDKFISEIEKYLKDIVNEDFSTFSKQERLSFMVFLYMLHGIFYRDTALDKLVPLHVEITSELTLGAGTGSSASFCVCIAAALLYYKNMKVHGESLGEKMTFSDEGLKLISKWAFNGEKIMHGKPSGIDNTVATFGSFIEVKSETDSFTLKSMKKFLNLDKPPKINVLLINTGVSRTTSKLVEKVVKLKSRNPVIVEHVLNAMHEVCERVSQIISDMGKAQISPISLITQGDNANTSYLSNFELLEELVDMNQGLLYSLGVSHVSLQDICLICSRHGLHAKLTGAGGGGYAFALVPPNFDNTALSNCIHELKKHEYHVTNMELGTYGVRLEHD